jgi:two-component system CheB/CheR fusion protein
MPAQQESPPRSLHCRVLVVDDRREVRYLAQHFIEEAGGTVQTAGNGAEAIAVIEKATAAGQQFDLVVMDMQMPVLDGYQTIARLRSNNFQAPILALTAAAMQGDRDRCLQAGCDDYLSKPIEGYRLVDLVAHYTQDYTLAELAQRRQQRQLGGTGHGQTNNSSLRVLLVEDSEDACKALSMLLKMSGYEAQTATSGQKALEVARTFTPDIVLLDIGLPDMDGYELLQQLRRLDCLRNTTFIALSGRGEPEDQERSRQAGFLHHLVKPVEYASLEALLLSRK